MKSQIYPHPYPLYLIHPQLPLIFFFLLLMPSFSISIHPSLLLYSSCSCHHFFISIHTSLLLISIYFCMNSYHYSFNSFSSLSFYKFHLSFFYRFIFFSFSISIPLRPFLCMHSSFFFFFFCDFNFFLLRFTNF